MGDRVDYIIFGGEHGSRKKWYYVLGVLSIVLGLISLRCEFYLRFLENDPVRTLEELGGHGVATALVWFLIIGMSSVGAVLDFCALYIYHLQPGQRGGIRINQIDCRVSVGAYLCYARQEGTADPIAQARLLKPLHLSQSLIKCLIWLDLWNESFLKLGDKRDLWL